MACTCSTPGGLPGVPFVQQSCTAAAMPPPTLGIVSLHAVHLLPTYEQAGQVGSEHSLAGAAQSSSSQSRPATCLKQ